MSDAIGQILPFAVAVGLSPVPIVAVVLATPRAVIMAVLCLVIGAKLIGDGIAGL